MRKQIEDSLAAVYAATGITPVHNLNLMQKLTNRIMSVAIFYACIIVIGGAIFAIAEGKSYIDGIWWAIVTSTTVGYGDFYPTTIAGRFCGAVVMMLSVFIVVPLLTAQFAAQLIVNSDAFTHAEQEELKADAKAVKIMVQELLDRLDTESNKS